MIHIVAYNNFGQGNPTRTGDAWISLSRDLRRITHVIPYAIRSVSRDQDTQPIICGKICE